MKQIYTTPEIEVYIFNRKDVIKASGDTDNGYLNLNEIPLDEFFLS